MSTLAPNKAAAKAKVLAKACIWADQRRAAQAATANEKARAVGRYEVSINDLSEAVEKYRKAGQP